MTGACLGQDCPHAAPGGAPTTGDTLGNFDVVVIGGGLAGLTAGLFAARYGHCTLVLEATVPGGHLINVEKIEDFPGFPEGIAGYALCPLVQEQAQAQGVEFALAEVETLTHDAGADPANQSWTIVAGETYRARTVIVAAGAKPKPLGVPGEERLYGHGVSHCATCDGPFFRGRVVGVAGGGSAALQEALTLVNHASQVLIFNPD